MTRALLLAAALVVAIVTAPTAGADHYWDVFDEQVAGAPPAGYSPRPCDRVDNPELLECLDDAEATFREEIEEAERMKIRRYNQCDNLDLSTDECINWFVSAYEDEVSAADRNLQEAIDDCAWWFGE